MNDEITSFPKMYAEILTATEELGFTQLSGEKVGSLLSTLCSSKIRGQFLELGTGTGLCTAWMLHGMCRTLSLITVDNAKLFVNVAKKYLAYDQRVTFNIDSGESVIQSLEPLSIDVIFADTWPGKYSHLDETIDLLTIGGFYVIDDMLPQDNWPEGHSIKALALIDELLSRTNITVTKLCWSSGLCVCVKIA